MRLLTLGESTIRVGRRKIGPSSELIFGTTVFLASQEGRRVSREALVELLWPDAEDLAARHSLRQAIYKVRQAGIPLEAEGGLISIPPKQLEADYDPFVRWSEDQDPTAIAPHARGEFLPSYAPGLSAAFDAWLEERRAAVHGHVRRVLLAAIAEHRRRDQWADVERVARQCLGFDPFNDEATLALAEATAMAGGKSEAVAIIDRYADEMGIDATDMLARAQTLKRRIMERVRDSSSSSAGQTPFVGRQDVFTDLCQQIDRATKDRYPRHVVLIGEPGIGKSRLLLEAEKRLALKGQRCLTVDCRSDHKQLPFSTISRLAEQLLDVRGVAGATPSALKTLQGLVRPTPFQNTTHARTHLTTRGISHALRDVIAAAADESALVVLIDDLHFADDRSFAVLQSIAIDCAARPFVLVVTTRPTDRPFSSESWLMLHVGPLSDEASKSLADSILHEEGRPFHTNMDRVVRASGGNPFFLRELLYAPDELRLPASVSGAFTARIADLRPSSKLVLECLAILGTEASVTRLSESLQLPAHELGQALNELTHQGFLSNDSSRLALRHELLTVHVRDHASGTTKAFLHGRVASVLSHDKAFFTSRQLAWGAAQHFLASRDRERATEGILRACRALLAQGRFDDAAALVGALEATFAPPDELVRQARLEIARESGDWLAVQSLVQKARRESVHSEKDSERHDEAELAEIEAKWHLEANMTPLLQRILSCIAHSQDHTHRLRASIYGLSFADNLRDEWAARSIYNAVSESLQRCRDEVLAAKAELIYGSAIGDRLRVRRAASRLISASSRRNSRPLMVETYRHVGFGLQHAGYYSDAIDAYERSARTAMDLGHLSHCIMPIAHQLVLERRLGRIDRCDQLAGELREIGKFAGDDLISKMTLHIALARHMCFANNYDGSDQTIDELTKGEASFSGRGKAAIRGALILLRCNLGRMAEDAEIAFLQCAVAGNFDRVGLDDDFVALVAALRSRGECSTVVLRQQLRGFLKRRSEQAPVAYELRTLWLQCLGAL